MTFTLKQELSLKKMVSLILGIMMEEMVVYIDISGHSRSKQKYCRNSEIICYFPGVGWSVTEWIDTHFKINGFDSLQSYSDMNNNNKIIYKPFQSVLHFLYIYIYCNSINIRLTVERNIVETKTITPFPAPFTITSICTQDSQKHCYTDPV